MSTMDLQWEPVRIRLLFEEPGILSKAQLDQGLAKSWYLVTAESLSIAHLAARIQREYRLGGSCPQGLVLEVLDFVLPSRQSVRILRDSDLVRVRRKQERILRVQSRELITNSLSFDSEEIDHAYRIGREDHLAIDEFVKEAGGYQGELSDGDAEVSLSSGEKLQSALDERKRSRALASSGTKRKRSLYIDSHTQNNLLVLPSKRKLGPEGIDSEPGQFKKQKSSGKKKHDKLARADRGSSQIVARELSMPEDLPRAEDVDRGNPAKSEKKKKKKRRELVEQAGPDVNCAGASPANGANAQEGIGKRRKATTLKETGNLEKPAGIESVSQKFKPGSSRKGEKSKKRQDTNHDNPETDLLNEKRYGTGLAYVNDEDIIPQFLNFLEQSIEGKGVNGSLLSNEITPEQVNSAEKRPSRSARRKKAKRRWLREHGQNDLVSKKGDANAQETVPKNRTDARSSETSEDETEAEAEAEAQTAVEVEVEAEAEAEAEEEILPIMCAPGHIRFEPVEDARDDGRCAAPVLLSYAEVRCKKQGQAWGQEKSRGRYSEGGYNRHGKIETRPSEGTVEQPPSDVVVVDTIDFVKFPLLSRIPVVGDLLAYQLVELTSSWTPELSSYRVGKVSIYDGASTVITLEPVPEYPVRTQQSEVQDESLNEDVFLPPYTSDGTLEVNLATLMEVRVVEAGPVQVNCQSQESFDVNATTANDPITSPEPAAVPPEIVEPPVADQLKAASSADNTQIDHSELRAGGDHEGGEVGRSSTVQPEPVLDQSTDAGWEEMLSQVIVNKKLELSLKASKELESQSCDAHVPAADGAKTWSNQGTAVEIIKRKPRVPPIIRHRYMRTGALGPTMALLRASQKL